LYEAFFNKNGSKGKKKDLSEEFTFVEQGVYEGLKSILFLPAFFIGFLLAFLRLTEEVIGMNVNPVWIEDEVVEESEGVGVKLSKVKKDVVGDYVAAIRLLDFEDQAQISVGILAFIAERLRVEDRSSFLKDIQEHVMSVVHRADTLREEQMRKTLADLG